MTLNNRDLEVWVRGHSRSFKLVLFQSFDAVSYSPSIVTMVVSLTVYEIFCLKVSRALETFDKTVWYIPERIYLLIRSCLSHIRSSHHSIVMWCYCSGLPSFRFFLLVHTVNTKLRCFGCVVLFTGWFRCCIRLEHSDASLMHRWNQPVNKTTHPIIVACQTGTDWYWY